MEIRQNHETQTQPTTNASQGVRTEPSELIRLNQAGGFVILVTFLWINNLIPNDWDPNRGNIQTGLADRII